MIIFDLKKFCSASDLTMARSFRWGRALTIFLIFWLGCLVYLIINFMGKSQETESGLQAELEGSRITLERMQKENKELRSLLRDVQSQMESERAGRGEGGGGKRIEDFSQAVTKFMEGPSKQYEVIR